MQQINHTVTLITGGSRSGKSSHALSLAEPFNPKTFLATAQAMDEEMKYRIDKHQKERGDGYQTVEEPLEVAEAIRNVASSTGVIVLDCLTVWLGNMLHHFPSSDDRNRRLRDFFETITSPPCDIIVVTNEVGMGIVPENKLSRLFRDEAGFLNQRVAALADRVVLTVSGIPLTIK